jgi:hypothetical protein
MGPLLSGARQLAAALADALAGMCADSGSSGCEAPALQLLVKLVGDHGALRASVSKRMAQLLADREWCDGAVRSALDDLADALAKEIAPGAQSRQDADETPSTDLDLDYLVLLPSDPLKTLAEYVAFMKALGGSGDPASVMAAHGMDQEGFVACVSRWSAVLASDDRLPLRYAELMRQKADEATA